MQQPTIANNRHPPPQRGCRAGDPGRDTTAYSRVVDVLRRSFEARLKTVVLFGSRARGDARPDSDHDLLVAITELPRDPVARARMLNMPLLPILHELPARVSLVGKTPAEIQADLTPLLLEVCADGVCLYGADWFEPLRDRALEALGRSGLVRRRVAGTLMWVFPDSQPRTWELTWEQDSDDHRDLFTRQSGEEAVQAAERACELARQVVSSISPSGP